MTDVLLTHSYHLPFDRKQVRKMQPYPPLGTLYAAALLRQHGFSVALFDTMLNDPSGFSDALRQHRPRIVAVYDDDFNFLTKMCLTRMRDVAWQMLNEAHAFGAITIAHGSDATDHLSAYLGQHCDFVLIGESEHTLLELTTALLSPGEARSVPGIAFLDSNTLKKTLARPPLSHPNELPSPARDLIDIQQYRHAWESAHGYFSLNAISSRGCPFRCNWCAKPIFGDNFHVRPAKEVADEICTLQDEYGADHVWFADDIFALNRHWVLEFADAMTSRGCVVPFKIQARADLMTNDTVRALSRAGCHEVWMGAESGSQRVLNAMEKGLLVEEVINARNFLRQAGIRACYFLQFGYPGETWIDIEKTIELVRTTRPDDIGVSLAYPLPNTRFHERVEAQMGSKHNWSDSDDLCIIFKGAYTDDFYRAVRDALHGEVETFGRADNSQLTPALLELWNLVRQLEPISRNSDPTQLNDIPSNTSCAASTFVPAHQLSARGGD